jgi:hypothetical protein
MTASKFISSLFLMGLLVGQSRGFAGLPTSYGKFHATNSPQTTMDTATSLFAFTMPDDLHVDSPLLTTMGSLLLSSMSATSSTLLDPIVEAEVLSDMSYVADFASLLNSSKALLKMSSVIGRVLVILADYIPDHSIHPEELFIQLVMLGVAIKNLTSSSMGG